MLTHTSVDLDPLSCTQDGMLLLEEPGAVQAFLILVFWTQDQHCLILKITSHLHCSQILVGGTGRDRRGKWLGHSRGHLSSYLENGSSSRKVCRGLFIPEGVPGSWGREEEAAVWGVPCLSSQFAAFPVTQEPL